MSNYRIGIDCRLAGQSHAGIGRYTVELVKRVTAHKKVDWVLFYSHKNQISQIFTDGTIPSNCTLVHTPVKHYTLEEQVKMNNIFTKESLDLLHVPHFNIPVFYSRPLVITIHDLLWHEHKGAGVTTLPGWKYWIKYGFYRLITRVAVKKALSVFVPTNSVRSTLKNYFPESYKKVIVTPEGISEELLQQGKKLKHLKRETHSLLYVGSLYPHKNVALILRSLQQLPDYRLIIVSSRNIFRKKLEELVSKLQLQDRVTFYSNVDDSKLAEMYKTATALVQPSFSEGFGLTGLEAISFRTPVLASNIAVFKEVYKSAAIYFNPHSVEDFCKAVHKIEEEEKLQLLTEAAPAVLKKNNWDDLANRTYLSYLRILNT